MADSKQYESPICRDITVVIADGATVSSVASLQGTSLVAIDIPAGFEGTAMTFQVSSDNVTYYAYKRMFDGVDVAAVVGANAAYAADSGDFAGYSFIKLVAGTAQTGAIEITLKTRPL